MHIGILMRSWRAGLLFVQQVNPEAGIDTVLGRFALCGIVITFSLLAVMFVAHRRRLQLAREQREKIAGTPASAIEHSSHD